MVFVCVEFQAFHYELQKGDWTQSTKPRHWKEDSLYLTEGFFADSETGQIFFDVLDNINWFGPNQVLPNQWADMMGRAVRSENNRTRQLMQQVDVWAQKCLAEHHMFYLLGP